MAKRYTVYTIVKRERKDDFWLNIGVAFPHEDGKGFNVFLQALPLGDGKIVLREADAAQTGEAADDRREDTRQEAPRSQGRDNGPRDDRRPAGGRR